MTATAIRKGGGTSGGTGPSPTTPFRNAAARTIVVDAAKTGWLGRMARDVELGAEIDRIYDDPERVNLAIWRAHQACRVHAASRVALDLLAHEVLDVAVVADGLGPDAGWPEWLCGPVPAASRTGSLPRESSAGEAAVEEFFLRTGCEIRPPGDPCGALGLRLSGSALEVAAGLFGSLVALRTWEGAVWLETGLEFPDTVRAASVGRPVEAVFDHPALRGRGYVVATSEDASSFDGSGAPVWRLGFAAEQVPWRPPWASVPGVADGSGDGDRMRR